jgi:tetratricopeptide (TPR) repeat protein
VPVRVRPPAPNVSCPMANSEGLQKYSVLRSWHDAGFGHFSFLRSVAEDAMLRTLALLMMLTSVLATPASATIPDDIRICGAQNGIPSIQACTRLLQTDLKPPERHNVLVARAIAYLSMSDANGALIDLNLALSFETSATAFVTRGKIYFARGEYQRALSDFIACLKIEPNHKAARKGKTEASQALTERPTAPPSNKVREVVDTIYALCVAGGENFVISGGGDADIDISLKRLDLAGHAKGEIKVNKSQAKGLVDGLSAKMNSITAQQASEVRKCIEPYRDRIMKLVLP